MTSIEELQTQAALDDAIRLLYRSRPAKVARLLGLIEERGLVPLQQGAAQDNGGAISLAEKTSSAIGFRSGPILNSPSLNSMGSSRFNTLNPNNPVRESPQMGEIKDIAMNQGDMGKTLAVDKQKGPSPSTTVSASREVAGPGIAKMSMTQDEYLMYASGVQPDMGMNSDLTPGQMTAFGGGGIGLVAANRMRSGNTARRELDSVRRQFMSAVQDGTLDSKTLKNLNQELKLRGSKLRLNKAPTLGIAEAQLARAEKDLASKILKTRYRGTLPLLAAGLLGTLAYNKLNEG